MCLAINYYQERVAYRIISWPLSKAFVSVKPWATRNRMTDLLYYQDAYLTECDARVVHVDEDGIALDRTVFYAIGGGPAR